MSLRILACLTVAAGAAFTGKHVLAEPPGMLAQARQERSVLAGKVQAEVEAALASARRLMRDDPAETEQNLKLMLENLERMPDLDAAISSQLRQQVKTAIREARQQRTAADQRRAETQQSRAAAQESRRLANSLENRQQRLKQLVERFNSLLDEQRHSVASEQIVPQVRHVAPGAAIAASLNSASPLQQAVHDNDQTARARGNNFVRTLASVESAAVPFMDEPPLVYPAAERWEELTRKREQFTAVQLQRKGKAEQRIFDELNKTMTLEVLELPLQDVMRFLSDAHDVPIVISTKKLEEAGVSLDTPVTKSLRGISLRSALRLILKELELSYMVQDEVIQITTPEDAAMQLTHKVYPVGDLVVPIRPPTNIFGLGGLGGMNGGIGTGNPLGNGMLNGSGNQAVMPAMNGPGMPPMNPGIF